MQDSLYILLHYLVYPYTGTMLLTLMLYFFYNVAAFNVVFFLSELHS